MNAQGMDRGQLCAHMRGFLWSGNGYGPGRIKNAAKRRIFGLISREPYHIHNPLILNMSFKHI